MKRTYWTAAAIAAGMAGMAGTAGITSISADAFADDDNLILMGEPASYTSVADAFDEGDLFDLNLSVGYRRIFDTGTIERETVSGDWSKIATSERLSNALVFGLEVGVWRDLSLFAEVPLVLDETRELKTPPGRSATEVNPDLCEGGAASLESTDGVTLCDAAGSSGSSDGVPLFTVPFESQARSGVPYIDTGLTWAVTNQFRNRYYPTWVLRIGGRFSVGDLLAACEKGGDCKGPFADSGPGIDEGYNALRFETRASWRAAWIEPYVGFSFQLAFPTSEAKHLYSPSGDLDGYINTSPPQLADVVLGASIVPWEHKGHYQRFAVDLRFTGTYVSEGRGASALFDMLGTSDSPYLTTPQTEGANGEGENVEFNGMTDMQAHGRFGGRLGLEMQAARYIKFGFGVGGWYSTAYVLTHTDACNPNADPSGDDDVRIGTCRDGILNPNHRSVLDTPGNRFRMNNELELAIDVTASAQF